MESHLKDSHLLCLMHVVYSEHAKRRMKQRGITELEVEYLFTYPHSVRKSFDGRKEVFGEINGRPVKVEIIELENYIKIITVI